MNKLLIAFVLSASLAAFGQGRGGGHAPAGGPPTGAGSGMGSGVGVGVGHGPSDVGRPEPGTHGPSADHQNGQNQQTQRSLKDSQINSGSFQMLEKKTGMTADQLKALYASSGAKNYGQFVSAVVVSKNLGLDTQQVLDGLKDKSLGSTLQDLGVSKSKADDAVKQEKKEIKQANKKH
jgi:hypothetical protein